MQFLYPNILWALLALLIPIIIHLFHFRRFKKVYFTNVKLLKEIKEEKSTRRQLRNLLVLLSRLLALAFLIFAFAQPFLSKNNTTKTGKNNVSIFIDNSNSMMANSEDIPLLDKAKKKAEEIVSAYGPSDEFQIIAHELKGSQQRWISKENTIQAIEEIDLNPEVNLLSNIYKKQEQSQPEEGNHIIYYISDFQKTITDFEFEKDSLTEINFIPLQSIKESNIAIDSVWFESVVPSLNQNNKLFVRVNNYGNEVQDDVRISLVQNNQTRPEGKISIPAQGSKVDTVNLLITQPGWQNIEIKIDDYPIQFDDSYFISFNVKATTKVLTINEGAEDKYLTAVINSINSFSIDNVRSSSIQYDQFKDYDLIILNDLTKISSGLASELKTFVENGGNFLFFPNSKGDIDSYNSLFNTVNCNTIVDWSNETENVYRINTSEFVFSNVYTSTRNNLKLPTTKGKFNFNNISSRGGEFLLKYRNGQDYMTKYGRGKGNVFVSASPLDNDYNDLVVNAEIFVPLIYKIAYSSNQNDKLAFSIGKDNFTEVTNSSTSNEIIYKITGAQEIIPRQSNLGNNTLINFNNLITKAGYYDLVLNEEKVKTLAFNFDRLESNLDYFNVSELNEEFGENVNILDNSLNADLGNLIKEKDQGITYWRLCLMLALLFLAIETMLLRFWKLN